MLSGFYRREDREWHRVGTLGVWVLAPHSKKRHTVVGLLGRPLKIAPTDTRPVVEPSEEELAELRDAALARALAWARDDDDPRPPAIVLTDK